MARNLQAKLPSSDTLRVFDINAESIQKFAEETKALGSGAAVTIAASVREAAEDSVSFPLIVSVLRVVTPHSLYDEFVLSMI
jgi:3-hydroxyisobutyrate dehydrogenase